MIFVLYSIEKEYNPPALTAPSLSHLTSGAPTKSNLYLANPLAAVVSDPDLYRLFTFHVPNLMSIVHCICLTSGSFQVRGTGIRFVTRPVFTMRGC